MSLPGAQAVCRGGVLNLCPVKEPVEDVLLQAGENTWGNWLVTVRFCDGDVDIPEDTLLLTDTSEELRVGRWRGGEGLELSGSRGKRSIKRLLTERGVTAAERGEIPSVRAGGKAAAVYGLGADIHFLPEKNNKKIMITFQKREI